MDTAPLPASWLKILPTLTESQARWFAAEKALELGRGGLRRVHAATGLSEVTIRKGIRELQSPEGLPTTERIRRPGGGRKSFSETDPGLARDLETILAESTAGDPMSPLKWTLKSTRRLASDLRRAGHAASPMTVCRLLAAQDYSLQANAKNIEGGDHPSRDAQFRYIAAQVKKLAAAGDPVVSVDTKKRELVGNFKNAGRTYRKKGDAREVNVYDFRGLGEGVAIPYGLYDVTRNQGMVNVGKSRDTAEFAVESIRQWWRRFGKRHYPTAKRLLICADGGGSNGSRNRSWKLHLQELSDETGLKVTVCHYPPGTSKWNKIEHRMFSFISINWKGIPLENYQTVISLIGSTKTNTGLKVSARLDDNEYEKGIKVSKEQMASINLKLHGVHPQWNYTIQPR